MVPPEAPLTGAFRIFEPNVRVRKLYPSPNLSYDHDDREEDVERNKNRKVRNSGVNDVALTISGRTPSWMYMIPIADANSCSYYS